MFAGRGLASTATSTATQPVRGHAPRAVNVTISPAAPKLGDVLTGAYTYADTDGDTESGTQLIWARDGVQITGANGRTYTTTTNDGGKTLTFLVVPRSSAPADPDTGVSVASRPATVAQPIPIVDVTDITGTLMVGQTLTGVYIFNANGGSATNASTTMWKNGGHNDIDGDNKYNLAGNDVGKILTFEVTAKNGSGVIGNTDSIDTAHAPGVTGGGGGRISPLPLITSAGRRLGTPHTPATWKAAYETCRAEGGVLPTAREYGEIKGTRTSQEITVALYPTAGSQPAAIRLWTSPEATTKLTSLYINFIPNLTPLLHTVGDRGVTVYQQAESIIETNRLTWPEYPNMSITLPTYNVSSGLEEWQVAYSLNPSLIARHSYACLK